MQKPNTVGTFDGQIPHWSDPFDGKRVSIVAFLHKGTSELSSIDRENLESLGLNLDGNHLGSQSLVRGVGRAL